VTSSLPSTATSPTTPSSFTSARDPAPIPMVEPGGRSRGSRSCHRLEKSELLGRVDSQEFVLAVAGVTDAADRLGAVGRRRDHDGTPGRRDSGEGGVVLVHEEEDSGLPPRVPTPSRVFDTSTSPGLSLSSAIVVVPFEAFVSTTAPLDRRTAHGPSRRRLGPDRPHRLPSRPSSPSAWWRVRPPRRGIDRSTRRGVHPAGIPPQSAASGGRRRARSRSSRHYRTRHRSPTSPAVTSRVRLSPPVSRRPRTASGTPTPTSSARSPSIGSPAACSSSW